MIDQSELSSIFDFLPNLEHRDILFLYGEVPEINFRVDLFHYLFVTRLSDTVVVGLGGCVRETQAHFYL